jgi:hypothetical protein
MKDGWFYAEEEKPVGPVTNDALVTVLRKKSDPSKVRVWRVGFSGWVEAKDIPEIADELFHPPPLFSRQPEDTRRVEQAQPCQTKDAKRVQTNTRGRAIFFIALAGVLIAGALLSSIIYNNSIEGIAYLAGEFVGAAVILSLLSLPWRRSTYTGTIVLVIATLSVGLSNRQKLIDGVAAREGMAALTNARDPGQVEKALEQNPSNVVLQLAASAFKEAQETKRLVERLTAEIEPSSLDKEIDHAKATRADLEAYRRDLKVAEGNASASMPRYLALLKDERRKVEAFGQSLKVDEGVVRNLLSGIDKRHARFAGLTSKLLTAHEEFYRAYGNAFAILIEQFGNYKVDASGRFIFQNQSIASRYNVASDAVSRAANRLAELAEEEKQLVKFQQDGWERFVAGK